MTKYRLSVLSGVPHATLNNICSGRSRIEKCSAETLYKLAQILHVTIAVSYTHLHQCVHMRMHTGLDADLGAHLADRVGEFCIAQHALSVGGANKRGTLPHHALHVHIVRADLFHESNITLGFFDILFGIIGKIEIQILKIKAVSLHLLQQLIFLALIVVCQDVYKRQT